MRMADVLAVPSVWPEPFGLVGIEAGCVGLPSVGYACGGIPDWLIPGVSGESAPGERPNPKELASALVRALADDQHLQRLRIGAWETAKQFSSEVHIGKLSETLRTASLTESPTSFGIRMMLKKIRKSSRSNADSSLTSKAKTSIGGLRLLSDALSNIGMEALPSRSNSPTRSLPGGTITIGNSYWK